MRYTDRAIPLLEELRKMGVRIWIDNFGTGYSSLSYLKKLSITGLKIERSFVKKMQKNNDDTAIAGAIIALAQSVNLSVVAEGIELESQLNLLDKQGCDYAQGYLYAKPLPDSEFQDWTKQWNSQFKARAAGA
jgi:EAL domain-containing protein (putative c-di-GMP-specific phosphodiesterase class I)